MNITHVNGTYSKELKANIDEIAQMVIDSTTSVSTMKRRIRSIISPAFINKNAKPRFLSYLNNCGSKAEILRLCQNTIRKAENYYR